MRCSSSSVWRLVVSMPVSACRVCSGLVSTTRAAAPASTVMIPMLCATLSCSSRADPQTLGHDDAGRGLLVQGSEVFAAFAVHPPEDPRDREPQREPSGPLGRAADGLPVDVDVVDERVRDARGGADGGGLRRRAAMYPLKATSRMSMTRGRAPNMPPRTDSPRTRREDGCRHTAHQQDRKGEDDAKTHRLEVPEGGEPEQAVARARRRQAEHQRVEAGGGQHPGL